MRKEIVGRSNCRTALCKMVQIPKLFSISAIFRICSEFFKVSHEIKGKLEQIVSCATIKFFLEASSFR